MSTAGTRAFTLRNDIKKTTAGEKYQKRNPNPIKKKKKPYNIKKKK